MSARVLQTNHWWIEDWTSTECVCADIHLCPLCPPPAELSSSPTQLEWTPDNHCSCSRSEPLSPGLTEHRRHQLVHDYTLYCVVILKLHGSTGWVLKHFTLLTCALFCRLLWKGSLVRQAATDSMGRTHLNMALRTSTLPRRGSHDIQAIRSPKGVRDSVLSRTPTEVNIGSLILHLTYKIRQMWHIHT